MSALLRRLRPRRTLHATEYSTALNRLFRQFIAERHPESALPEEQFLALLERYQSRGTIAEHATYEADLWELFEPDYRERLDEYYRGLALHHTMRFLEYARNPALLEDHYLTPYRAARAALGRFSVLELGAGLPHGLLHEQLRDGGFCESLTVNDIDAPYSRFVEWFCAREGIPFSLVEARGGAATALPDGAWDFVFAKDVFEHLVDPRDLLEQVLARASRRALLALDLEHKGEPVYQHVSPDLLPLAELAEAAGFEAVGRSGSLTMFRRRPHDHG